MPIPALDHYGLLPAGVWDCTLDEIATEFCGSPHRRGLWDGLHRFIATELNPHGVTTLWIDGSFTRRKDYPEDIDIVVDATSWDEVDALRLALRFCTRHGEIKAAYHVDPHVRHPAIPADLARYFQYAGVKCAAELHIDKHHPKGILRVQI